MSHEPAATVPVQLSTPSPTVTSPLGRPAPGATGATAYCTVTASPTIDGSGLSALTTVVVLARLTPCPSAAELLPPNCKSPASVAVNDRAPAVAKVNVHWPADTVAVHESVPSPTVTSPVGVPAPGALGATS